MQELTSMESRKHDLPPRIFEYDTQRNNKWGHQMQNRCQTCAARIHGFKLLNDKQGRYPFAIKTDNPKDIIYGRLLVWTNKSLFGHDLEWFNRMNGYCDTLNSTAPMTTAVPSSLASLSSDPRQYLFDRSIVYAQVAMPCGGDRTDVTFSQSTMPCILYYRPNYDDDDANAFDDSEYDWQSPSPMHHSQSHSFEDDYIHGSLKSCANSIATTDSHTTVSTNLSIASSHVNLTRCQSQFEKFLSQYNMIRYSEEFKRMELNDIRLVPDFTTTSLSAMNPAHRSLFLRKCQRFNKQVTQFDAWISETGLECLKDVLEDNGMITLPIVRDEMTSKPSLRKWLSTVHDVRVASHLDSIVDTLWNAISSY